MQERLWNACNDGQEDIVQQLLLDHTHWEVDRIRGVGFTTPLHVACGQGHAPIVVLLLEHGASSHAQDHNGWTPLAWAAQRGHVEIAQMLMCLHHERLPASHDRRQQHLSLVNLEDQQGITPLARASRQGHFELVHLLLQFGANVHVEDHEGFTPLSRAMQMGHVEVAQLLVDHGA